MNDHTKETMMVVLQIWGAVSIFLILIKLYGVV
jgi:hypothetical protein